MVTHIRYSLHIERAMNNFCSHGRSDKFFPSHAPQTYIYKYNYQFRWNNLRKHLLYVEKLIGAFSSSILT